MVDPKRRVHCPSAERDRKDTWLNNDHLFTHWMGLKTSVTEWGRLLAGGGKGIESLNYTWAKTRRWFFFFLLPSRRGAKYMCRPGRWRWGQSIDCGVWWFNHTVWTENPVKQLRTHSPQLVFLWLCLSISWRLAPLLFHCLLGITQTWPSDTSTRVKRAALYKIHLKNASTHRLARFA